MLLQGKDKVLLFSFHLSFGLIYTRRHQVKSIPSRFYPVDESSCSQEREKPWSTDKLQIYFLVSTLSGLTLPVLLISSQDKDELTERIPSLDQQTVRVGQIPAPALGSCSLGPHRFPFPEALGTELLPKKVELTPKELLLNRYPCTVTPVHKILIIEVKLFVSYCKSVGIIDSRTYIWLYVGPGPNTHMKVSHYSEPPTTQKGDLWAIVLGLLRARVGLYE
ncbi:Da2-20 [Rattus norvegicus]|uniref:Da2-20 n=2 Tax=Rattus norvegicus TaxID=10116 RepID=A6JGW6_RAT|nr:Da2-20 [Rattus norvegicus]EDL94972.1 Da2-20 [Rattus norvegicus]|eukprot:NP_001041392.1 uncharacterized protein LOC498308 [Rattus norvegicus]